MKKILVILVTILFIPFTVKAATPNVKDLEAIIDGTAITYNGTMEDGSYAVMCKLLDKDSNELDMLSSAVDSNAFNGTFTVETAGDYKVSCANYEGGDIKVVDVKSTTDETVTNDAKPVPTSDNIKTYVIVAISSILVIASATMYLKRKVKNN